MNIILKAFSTSGLKQIAKSFDRATIIKIVKGGVIAGTGACAIFILSAIGEINYSDANVAAAVAWGVPFLINLIKEFLAGEPK